jgi:prefoldin subunit 5
MLPMAGTGRAEDVKAMKGLNFQVPEDWPIEKRGGIVAPIPTEEYVAKKFKSVAEELQALKDELTAKFDELQSSIKVLESGFSGELKKVKSQGQGPAVVTQGVPDAGSSQELFKEGLDSLDRKVAGEVQSIKAQLEQVNSKLSSLDKKMKEIQAQLYKVDEKVDFIGQK